MQGLIKDSHQLQFHYKYSLQTGKYIKSAFDLNIFYFNQGLDNASIAKSPTYEMKIKV